MIRTKQWARLLFWTCVAIDWRYQVQPVFHFMISLGTSKIFRQWRNFYWQFFNLPPKKVSLPQSKLKMMKWKRALILFNELVIHCLVANWHATKCSSNLKYIQLNYFSCDVFVRVKNRHGTIWWFKANQQYRKTRCSKSVSDYIFSPSISQGEKKYRCLIC